MNTPQMNKKEQKAYLEQQRVADMMEHDNGFFRQHGVIAGVDEAGRGPLAGPVFAAAVILPPDLFIEGIDDSKKLSEKKRELLFNIITEKALAWCVASIDNNEIDDINILKATLKAMALAVEGLKLTPDYILVDGNQSPTLNRPHACVIKGDSKSINIAAAAILAKVSRDRCITALDMLYPEYGFAKHKGYGTAEHIEAIKKFGASPIHRMSFLKNIL